MLKKIQIHLQRLVRTGCDVGLQDNGRLLFLVGTSKNFTTYPDDGFPVHECEIQKETSNSISYS